MNKKKVIITAIVVLAVIVLGIKGKGLLEKRKSEVAKCVTPLSRSGKCSGSKSNRGRVKEYSTFPCTDPIR